MSRCCCRSIGVGFVKGDAMTVGREGFERCPGNRSRPRSNRPRPGSTRKRRSTAASRHRRHCAARPDRGRGPSRSRAARRRGGRSCGARRRSPVRAPPDQRAKPDRRTSRRGAGASRRRRARQVILAGREQVFAIVPRCRDQRYAAGERLEHPDRRNAGEHPRVGPARDVDGHARLGKGLRHAEIGEIAGVVDPGGFQRGPRRRPGSARHGRAPTA